MPSLTRKTWIALAGFLLASTFGTAAFAAGSVSMQVEHLVKQAMAEYNTAMEDGDSAAFIDTGETQRVPVTRDMTVYAWSDSGTKIRAAACDTARCSGWDLSLLGGSRRRTGAIKRCRRVSSAA